MSYLIAEIQKLKFAQQNLEKNQTLNGTVQDVSPEHKLQETYEELNLQRLKDTEQIEHEALNIWLSLQNLKNNTAQFNMDSTDFQTLQKQMTAIQTRLRELKLQISSNLIILHEQEINLNTDIDNFEKLCLFTNKTEVLQDVTRITSKCFPSRAQLSDNSDIKAFSDFLASSGGHENRWNICDHQLFLKTRKKFNDINKFLKTFTSMVPSITEDEVLKHEQWYCKYVELRDKQKSAIEHWRKQQNLNEELKKKIISSENNIQLSENKKNDFLIETDNVTKEKLKLWKKEQNDKLFEKKLQNEHIELISLQKSKLEADKREEIRNAVKEWKDIRIARLNEKKIENDLIISEEKKNRAMEANKMLKVYQYNDDLHIQKILKIKKIKEKSKSTNNLLKKSNFHNRNPERIFQPTKQWLSRCIDTKTSKEENCLALNNSWNVTNIPKLAVPVWIRNNER